MSLKILDIMTNKAFFVFYLVAITFLYICYFWRYYFSTHRKREIFLKRTETAFAVKKRAIWWGLKKCKNIVFFKKYWHNGLALASDFYLWRGGHYCKLVASDRSYERAFKRRESLIISFKINEKIFFLNIRF